MSERKRCCCNCRHCVRKRDFYFNGHTAINTYCEIDDHYIGYAECFEGWCRRWAKEQEET